MFKEVYDVPYIGCGIQSLQWSMIHRIGRHSAGYMRVVLYKL